MLGDDGRNRRPKRRSCFRSDGFRPLRSGLGIADGNPDADIEPDGHAGARADRYPDADTNLNSDTTSIPYPVGGRISL